MYAFRVPVLTTICVLLFLHSPVLAQKGDDDQPVNEDVAEIEEELRDAERQAERIAARLQLVRLRIQLLKSRRAAHESLAKLEIQLVAAEKSDDERRLQKLEQEFELAEIRSEHLAVKLELLDRRMGVLELMQETQETGSQPLIKEVQALSRMLDSGATLTDSLFQHRRAGREEAAGEVEEELERLEHRFHYRRDAAGLRVAMFFAEREGEDEHLEELAAELHALRDEFDIDTDKRARDDERMKESQKPRTAPSGPAPVQLTDEDIQQFGRLDFSRRVLPLMRAACFDCHAGESVSGDLNLEHLVAARPLVQHLADWQNVIQQLRIRSMPPADADQPSEEDRRAMLGWLRNAIENFDYDSVRSPGHEPPRRLTHDEFNNTVRDLTGFDLRPADRFPADMTATSGFKNSANSLFMQPILLERYVHAADSIVNAAWPLKTTSPQQEKAWNRLLNGANPVDDVNVKNTLRDFVSRAYRRPATADEIDRLFHHFQQQRDRGATVRSALRNVLQIVFVSPHFLFRSEQQPETRPKESSVSDWELASRLSYFLWATMPDEELFRAARKGTLHKTDVLNQHIDRMLDDPRSKTLGQIFAAQWLGVSSLDRVQRDQIDNPWATDSLVAAMKQESAALFNSLIRDNASLQQLVTADYTFLNEELARHYKIDGVEGDHLPHFSPLLHTIFLLGSAVRRRLLKGSLHVNFRLHNVGHNYC